MRGRHAEFERLAAAIVAAMGKQGFVDFAVPAETAQRRIVQIIEASMEAEAELERDAERLADAQGRAILGMDRRKIVLGIKARLARERDFPL